MPDVRDDPVRIDHVHDRPVRVGDPGRAGRARACRTARPASAPSPRGRAEHHRTAAAQVPYPGHGRQVLQDDVEVRVLVVQDGSRTAPSPVNSRMNLRLILSQYQRALRVRSRTRTSARHTPKPSNRLTPISPPSRSAKSPEPRLRRSWPSVTLIAENYLSRRRSFGRTGPYAEMGGTAPGNCDAAKPKKLAGKLSCAPGPPRSPLEPARTPARRIANLNSLI